MGMKLGSRISSPFAAFQQVSGNPRSILTRNVVTRATDGDTSALLDRFWLSRGVQDVGQRQRLVQVGLEEPYLGQTLLQAPPSLDAVIPGAASAWFLDDADGCVADDVARISHRLLALQRLLGERDDIDVVWMVQREPELLSTDASVITQRLVTLVTAEGAAGVDVVKLVESQPGLLLEKGSALIGQETTEQRQLAWAYGLLGDDDVQWAQRFEELLQYKAVHGDVHVGFRDGDESSLVRWAAKQREENSKGLLASERFEKLKVSRREEGNFFLFCLRNRIDEFLDCVAGNRV